jgi:hypothetical protein
LLSSKHITVLSLTYCYNYEILVFKRDESELVSIIKIVLQVICYKYKNRYKF